MFLIHYRELIKRQSVSIDFLSQSKRKPANTTKVAKVKISSAGFLGTSDSLPDFINISNIVTVSKELF